jgi:hypothetical protein
MFKSPISNKMPRGLKRILTEKISVAMKKFQIGMSKNHSEPAVNKKRGRIIPIFPRHLINALVYNTPKRPVYCVSITQIAI